MMDKINKKGDFKLLKEFHSLGSCLKAHFTDRTLEYVKIVRESCGGHGFLQYAGFANLIDLLAPNVTLEGDNYVMLQQTAKHIIKSVAKIMEGKQLRGSLSYLNDLTKFSEDKLKKFEPQEISHLESILKANVLYHVGRVAKYLQADQRSFEEKWNNVYQTDVVKVAQAHAIYMTATSFTNGLKTTKMSKGLHANLETLLRIHLSHSVITYADGAILSGFAKAKHLSQTEEYLYEQIAKIRPQLLNLVEAFDYSDNSLNSVIARSDSDLYENIFAASSSNPLNTKDKLDSFDAYVKPLSKTLSARL